MPVETHNDIVPATGIESPNVVETHEDIKPAMGVTAYHGSPHEFDEFDTSKIGTGEGAQAYGHGLYFAENEDVAQGYRYVHAPRGQGYEPVVYIKGAKGDKEKAIADYLEDMGIGNNPGDLEQYIKIFPWMAEITQSDIDAIRNFPSHMYEVRLDVKPEHLLDWDKPLSEQHPNVRKAFNMAAHPIKDEDDKLMHELFEENVGKEILGLFDKSKGSQAYNTLADKFGSQQEASKRLSDAGIRGIRYLDAGSRDKDKQTGSHNIVIFDPQHIKVKRRYAEGGEVPERDDEGVIAYAFGNSVPHIEQRLASGEFPEISKAYGGAINPLEIRSNDLEDEARRLIMWSYAVAPYGRNLALSREDGGRTYPVAMPTEIKEDLKAGKAKLRKLAPQEFLNESDPLHIGKGDRHIIRSFKHHIEHGDPLGPLKLYEGGHQDGRHRANAAKALGIKTVPVVDYRKADGGPVDDAQNAVNIARNLTPMGFYSAAAEATSKFKQKAPISQILDKLEGLPGVKAEELDQSGVRDAFAGQKSVDPKEVARHFQENLPQISEKVYGGKPPGEMKQPHSILNTFKEYDAPYENLEGFEDLYRVEPVRGKTYWIGEGRNGQFHLHGSDGTYYTDHESLHDANEAAHMMAHGRDPVKWKTYNGKPLILPEGNNYRELVMHSPVKPPTTNIELGEARPPGSEYGNKEFAGRWQGRQLVDGVTEYPFKIGREEGTITHWPQTFRYNGDSAPEMWIVNSPGIQNAGFPSLEAAKAGLQKEAAANFGRPPENVFRSDHWPQPNVLAHLRMQDRVGPDGKKALHIEEIQSDWAQKGRDEGFNPDKGIPSGPYVTDTNSWTDLALKRALKEAAEGGYDKMVWTPGETQADRYNLSKFVREVAYNPKTKTLIATTHEGDDVGPKEAVEPKDIGKHIGKAAAKKLLEQEPGYLGIHSLQGDDLKIGGHGMTEYYDRIVPSRLQAIVKKLDPEAKINLFSHDLPAPEGEGTIKGHALQMTPKLREAILKGLPAYEHGGSVLKHAFKVVSRYS